MTHEMHRGWRKNSVERVRVGGAWSNRCLRGWRRQHFGCLVIDCDAHRGSPWESATAEIFLVARGPALLLQAGCQTALRWAPWIRVSHFSIADCSSEALSHEITATFSHYTSAAWNESFCMRVPLFFWWMCEFHLAHSLCAVVLEAVFTEAVFINWDIIWWRFSPAFCKGRYHTFKLQAGPKGHAAGSILFCISRCLSQRQCYIHPSRPADYHFFFCISCAFVPTSEHGKSGADDTISTTFYIFTCCIWFHLNIYTRTLIYLSAIKTIFVFWLKI